MSEDTIKRSYAIYALCDGCPKQRQCNKDSEEWCEKGVLIRSAIPSADNEVIGKLKIAIENEEICKNCPTAERIYGENLLGAMALGFSYGMEAGRPQEWIPCSERLPEEDGYYLITLDFEWGREIEIGLWTDGEWFNDNRHANIAWMPMIEPWEGTDDEEL